jgi:predicted Rossmann-fold nucleotide-binding protein
MNTREVTLLERVQWTESTLLAILRDEKPLVDRGNPAESWLFDQIARMHAGFFVTDDAFAYTVSPKETPDMREFKGRYPFQTASHKVLHEADVLRKGLAARGVTNFRIAGEDYGLRAPENQYGEGVIGQESVLLAKSDFVGFYQFIREMRERLELENEDRSSFPPLILHNHDGYWTPFLKAFGISSTGASATAEIVQLLDGKNIHVTSRLSGVEAICKRECPSPQASPKELAPYLDVPSGSVVLVATRQNKKIHEIQEIFDSIGAQIRVMPFHVVMGRPKEAEENSKSYVGNNAEKRQEVLSKLDHMSAAEKNERFRHYGIDPDKLFYLVDDRGEETEYNIYSDPVFDDVRPYLNPYKRGIGVETANVLKAITMEKFFSLVRGATNRVKEKSARAVDGAFDYTCYLLWPNRDQQKVVAVTGVTEDRILDLEEINFGNKRIYSENFLGLKSDPEGRAKADIPHFLTAHSAMSIALRTLSKLTGVCKHRENGLSAEFTADRFNQEKSLERWKIGTPQTLNSSSVLSGKSAEWWTRTLSLVFKVAGASAQTKGHAYCLDTEHTSPVLTQNGDVATSYGTLLGFHNYERSMDGFFLGPIADFPSNEKYQMQHLFHFSSLVVGKQVFNPQIHPKPFVILQSSWNKYTDLYQHYHELGMIGDKPEHIFSTVRTKADAVRAFVKKFAGYTRSVPSDLRERTQGVEPPENLYRVTVYCSATSKNRALRQGANELGYELARSGFHVKNGGGTDGLMLEVSEGVIRYRNEVSSAEKHEYAAANGLSCIQCVDTAESEGRYDKGDMLTDHPTIYHRMGDLQDTDAEIFLAGGAGTIQEFAGTVLERLRTGRTENRPLVLVNQIIDTGSKQVKVWDKLLEFVPPAMRKSCNIHVVDTIEQALAIVEENRANLGMKAVYMPNPYLPANDRTLPPMAEFPAAVPSIG